MVAQHPREASVGDPVGVAGVVRHLRVSDDSAAPDEGVPVADESISEAARSGDRRGLLVALRVRLARELDSSKCQARDMAALSRRLLEVAREIAAIDSADGGDDVGKAGDEPDEDWDGDPEAL